MDISQLKYFCAVAKYQNISKASHNIYVTQPTLSQRIKRLETEMGIALFDRYGKSVKLNAYGYVVQRYAERIFQQLEDMERELADISNTGNTTISLSVNTSTKLLTQILPTFRKQYPDIRFIIAQNDYSRPDEDDYDLCINSSREMPEAPNEEALLREPLMLALPKNHSLSVLDEIPIQLLKNETFVHVVGKDLTEILWDCCRKGGFEPHIAFNCDYPSVTMDCVEMGLGIALVPTITWGDIATQNLIFRPIADERLTRYVSISWRTKHYRSKGSQLFQNFFTEYLHTHYPDAFISDAAHY